MPADWLPRLPGCRLLCLASGGGQQGPILAAAGARVTVYDNSPAQLARDREVAAREGLAIELIEGDMRDLSALADGSFDCIVHPVSNVFVPEVRPVWREAFRVLAPGGVLLAGFNNPTVYLFDTQRAERDELVVTHRIPYSDVADLTEAERRELLGEDGPLEFSHTLTDQIGGQIDAGFVLAGLYEDRYPEGAAGLTRWMDIFLATRARKPG